MNNSKSTFVLAVAAGLMASAVALAQGEVIPLPAEKMVGNVSYVTGGVPDEQLPAFKQARSSYPLGIEIYQKAGAKSEFTSGVQVKLIDKSGAIVLDAPTEGPFMWVKLPAGAYRIQATLKDRMVAKAVTVGAKGSTPAVLVFPENTD